LASPHAPARYGSSGAALGAAATAGRATRVSLLRWLRGQLRQPEPLRERLEAAIAEDDPAEARRIVARFAFSDAQRHQVERLIDDWEHNARPSSDEHV
jgi:hypothetical protein